MAVLLLDGFMSRAMLMVLLTLTLLINVAFTVAPAFNQRSVPFIELRPVEK